MPACRPRLNFPGEPLRNPTTKVSEVRLYVRACQANTYDGMFQVINHGETAAWATRSRRAALKFFDLSSPLLQKYCLSPDRGLDLYTSTIAHSLEVYNGYTDYLQTYYWRDVLMVHDVNLVNSDYWPIHTPRCFKPDMGMFVSRIKTLEGLLLRYMAQGVGLRGTYFSDGLLTARSKLMVTRYPRCPLPTLTCELPSHYDSGLLSIIHQTDGVDGLQIFVDGQWKLVSPRPDALIVTLGVPMQVVSNMRFKAANHRVVVNAEKDRTAVLYVTPPSDECILKPAEELTRNEPTRYEDINFHHYRGTHLLNYRYSTELIP